MVQVTFTRALFDTDNPVTCKAMYSCGMPGVDELGKAVMTGPKDLAALAAKVKEVGYSGEKVVIIRATDVIQAHPMALVMADLL